MKKYHFFLWLNVSVALQLLEDVRDLKNPGISLDQPTGLDL